MFENFSFVPSSIESIHIDTNDCDSVEISPFTSRCSSPRFQENDAVKRSQPAPRRDSRFDSYRALRHPSITALTAQLESHVLSEQYASDLYYDDASATESIPDNDEGFFDGPDTPATTISDYSSSDVDPSLYDLSMANLSATSSPRPSLSLEAQAYSSYTMRRRQRQALVRLQCLATRTPDLAMLIEECHPSSLPLSNEALWAGKARSNSTSNTGSLNNGRIDKDRSASTSTTSVRKPPRMRKRLTR